MFFYKISLTEKFNEIHKEYASRVHPIHIVICENEEIARRIVYACCGFMLEGKDPISTLDLFNSKEYFTCEIKTEDYANKKYPKIFNENPNEIRFPRVDEHYRSPEH